MRKKTDAPIVAEIKRLQRPLRGRRLFSWLLFAAGLLMFLVLPLAGSDRANELRQWLREVPALAEWLAPLIAKTEAEFVARRPSPDEQRPISYHAGDAPTETTRYRSPPPTVLALDRVWNPGPLAAAHQPWANDCKVCHSVPFVRVRNEDCLTCHAGIGEHVARTITAPGLTDQRCTSCHHDHRGEFGLTNQNTRFTGRECAACHRRITQTFAASETANVADFARAHPEFRVQLADSAESYRRVRLTKGQPLNEPTALKFPHDVHLRAKGIDSPNGPVTMACANCHTLQPDGFRFKPTTMNDHCQSCHALKMEPQVSNREVPHGSVTEVLSTLREFYAYVASRGALPPDEPALTRTIQIARPGQRDRAPSFVNATGDARSRAAAAATELFEKTSCVVCHDVSRKDGPGKEGTPGRDLPQWRIAPVRPGHVWMPKSVFNHSTHAHAKCVDCHQATSSSNAADVLIPGIGICRECHAGSEPVADKITSNCALCHAFHIPARLPPLSPAVAPVPIAIEKVAQ